MTCMKITESQNGQIYPEDIFSHGVAQMDGISFNLVLVFMLARSRLGLLPVIFQKFMTFD